MWARVLAAAASVAVLLTVVDLGLAGTDPARGLGDGDPLGAAIAVLGFMAWVALACTVPLALGVVLLVRRSSRNSAPLLACLTTLTALVWVDWALLVARPILGAAGVAAFVFLMLVLLTGMRRPRWRRASALAALVVSIGIAVANGRAFVGVNPAQHFALVVGAWSLALPAAWTLMARVEREAEGQGRGGVLLVLAGTLALAVLGWQGSGAANDSAGARYFVRRMAPNSAATLRALEPILDLDGDGFGGGFGGGDCAPFDPATFPGAHELVGDGIDQNCMAGDPSAADVAALHRALVGSDGPPARSARRILLVTVDALRHDHPLVAARERLGSRCRAFSTAYSAAPSTTYSVHALMTGRYASQATYTQQGRWNVPIDDPSPRVAELLREAGYATGASVFHHRFDPRLGLVKGFDSVWTAAARPEIIRGDAAAATVEQALGWLSQHRAPTFLWVHLYDPHEPYLSREGPGDPRERYAAEVRYTDARLVEFLDAMADLDQTAVVLTGDHAEAFGEHGEHLHGSSVFEEQVRVPLWVCPAAGDPVPVDPGPVSAVDVAPTLLALAGVFRPEGMGGRSLLAAGPAPVFAETAGEATPMTMLVQWPYKLMHLQRADLWLLFDLEADPGERINLADREPELLARLQGTLDAWLAWRGVESPTLHAH